MATNIFKFDGTLLTTVADGTLDTTHASVKFPGRGYQNYGEPVLESLLWVMENFAGAEAPPRPVTGQLWFDTRNGSGSLYIWNGNEWQPAGGVTVAPEPPPNPLEGALWYDTRNKQLKVWCAYPPAWDIVGPLGSKINQDILDPNVPVNSVVEAMLVKGVEDGLDHSLWRINIAGVMLCIISKDPMFTPQSSTLVNGGFPKLYPGINFNNKIPGIGINGDATIFRSTKTNLPSLSRTWNLGSADKEFNLFYSHVGLFSNSVGIGTVTGTYNFEVTGKSRFNGPVTLNKGSLADPPLKWTATQYLTTKPQVGAVEFDGSDFYFTGLLDDEPVRRTPLWVLNLNTTRNLYVSSAGGRDTNSGRNKLQPLKTIRRALQILIDGHLEGYTIFVESGEYREQNPLYVPKNTSIIGDNLRRVTIKPVHDTLDIFHTAQGNYFFGVTFKEHRSPSFALAFPCSTATATVEDGQIADIKITYSYGGYDDNNLPQIYVEPPPFMSGDNIQATPKCYLVNGAITDILISKRGTGYTSAPLVTITGAEGSGSGCIATARLDTNPLSSTYNQVIAIDISNWGSGYVQPVSVLLSGGGGTGATVGEVVVKDGVIGGVTWDYPESRGSGYTRPPWISIKPPNPEQVFSSPYVQNCSSITGPFDIYGKMITRVPPFPSDGIADAGNANGVYYGPVDPTGAGSGIRIDGEVVDNTADNAIGPDAKVANKTVIRSFVADAFTQINQGGIGHLMLNRGYAQFVSCFTTFSSVGYWARAGGFCNISNSVIDFGDVGIQAEGYYPIPYATGISYQSYRSTIAGVQVKSGGSGFRPLQAVSTHFIGGRDVGQDATCIIYTDVFGSVSAVAVITPGSGYKIEPTINWDVLDSVVTEPVTPVITVSLAPQSPDGNVRIYGVTLNGVPGKPLFGTGLLYNNLFHTVSNVTVANTEPLASDWYIVTEPPIYWMDPAQSVQFYEISNISTGGLALEYIGSGTTYNALPYYGGKPDASKQVIDGEKEGSLQYPGRIYYVTIDNTGNFRVGPYFRVNFIDGSVEFNAKTMKLPNIDNIGPFTRLRAGSGIRIPTGINTYGPGYADEINADPSLTHKDGPVDYNPAATGVGTSIPSWDKTTLVTQSAVRGYFNQVRSDILPHYQDNNVQVLTNGVSTFKWSLGNWKNKWKDIWGVNGYYNFISSDIANVTTIHSTFFDTQYAKIGLKPGDTTNARLSVRGSNVVVGSTRSLVEVRTQGDTYKELAGISLWGTYFKDSGDNDSNPKRSSDIVSGFTNQMEGYSAAVTVMQPNTQETGNWTCEYLAFHVGNSIVGESTFANIYYTPNDTGKLTRERMRIDGWGRVGIGHNSPMSQVEITATKSNLMSWKNKENHWNGLSILSGKGSGNMGLLLGADRNATVSYIQSVKTTGDFGTSSVWDLALNAQGGGVGIGTSKTRGHLTLFAKNPTLTIVANEQAGIGDTKYWDITTIGNATPNTRNTIYFRAVNDAYSEATTFMSATRIGYAISNVDFPHGTVTMSGALGIQGSLEVYGIIYGHADIIGYYTSDERLKTNVVSINDALMKVNSINGITFDWTDEAKEGVKHRNNREAGLIAQEVEKVLPEVVTTRDDGYKAVNYEKIVPLLVEAIKELTERVKVLEGKTS